MYLDSDFVDFYDCWFERGTPGDGAAVLRRTGGNTGPAKREQFAILEAAGFLTALHGTVGEVLGAWWKAEKCVVRAVVAYTDEMAHCAEGKVLYRDYQLTNNPDMGAPGGDRYWRERQLYCSAFVGNRLIPDHSCSIRRLQIGPHVAWLEYRSTTSWMSNSGDGSCELVGFEKDVGFHPAVKRPLWAADFVIGREMYAVDFNTAPGMRGSGVEAVLSGREVVAALEAAHHANVWEGSN